MNYKRIIGICLIVIGAVAIVYAVNCMHRIKTAKQEAGALSNLFSGSAVGDTAGDTIKHAASQYDSKVWTLLIGGIVLVVVGAGATICCCRHHHRK